MTDLKKNDDSLSPEPKDNSLKKESPKKALICIRKKTFLISILAVIAFLVIVAGGFTVDHISRTNPNFCGICHNMQDHVTSYLTSNHLDFVHNKAGVGCKNCHFDYSIPEELSSAVKYITGDYEVPFKKIRVGSEQCLRCHIDVKYQAKNSIALTRNPHDNHNGDLRCTTCHMSHDAQIDFCSDCHDNGGQMMIEERVDLYLESLEE